MLTIVGPAVGLALVLPVVTCMNPLPEVQGSRVAGWRRVLDKVVLGLFFAGAGTGLVLFLNTALSSQDAIAQIVPVTSLTPDRSGGDIEILFDEGYRRNLHVPRAVFDAAEMTCTVTVHVSPGALRMPWIRAVEAATESHPGTCRVRAESRVRN
jgi:hypothetical protein